MEPHKVKLKKTPQARKDVEKNRFQIAKLEERIAPRCHYGNHYSNPHGNCR